MSQSGLRYLENGHSLHDQIATQSGLPYLRNAEPVGDRASATNVLGHWRALLSPAEGLEGFTPYLHQHQFDTAVAVLDKDNGNVDTELIFNSTQEAYNWRARTRKVNPQSSADPTIPRTSGQKKAAVKLLFKAYKSVALATDNAGMLKAFEEQKHDNRQVETICWSIVEGCIDRCDRGPLLNAYEPEKAKNNTSIKTFAERLDAIVESLSHQKTICKHLLDAPYLNRFIDDPVGSKQRVESNRKLNKKKGGVMNVGKKALGMTGRKGRPRGDKTSDAVSDEEAEEYRSESQGFQGDSSGISSPFRTPDQPIPRSDGYSGPPGVGFNPLYSAERFRDESPTPSSRRRQAATTTSFSPLVSRASQSPYGEPYTSAAGANQYGMQRFQSPPMSMLPGSMMDPTMSSYTSAYSYRMGQATGSMNAFENHSVRLPISFAQLN